jgi:alcohol dehydrogenase (cytochrome c)
LKSLAIIAIFFCLAVSAVGLSAKGRQGLQIVRLKATDSLPDVTWGELFTMVRSKEHFGLPFLIDTPNPYASIQNPYSTQSDLEAGSQTFSTHCASCHGSNGDGGPGGPKLKNRHMEKGSSAWALYRTITYGIRGTGMPPNDLPWVDKWRLVSYVTSLAVTNGSAADTATIPAASITPVQYEMIRDSQKNLESWLTYSGTYDSHRFSLNNQVTTSNAGSLRLLWERQYNTDQASVETTPLVLDGYMFVTLPPNKVEALNASNGTPIWSYEHEVPADLRLCCGIHNRGLAVLGSTLYLGTLDAHLIALDIHNGKVLWDVAVANYKDGYSMTGAPLAIKNMIITGVGCGEFGAHGFVEALDPATGKQIWRFYTIPDPGQFGYDTWGNNSAKTGGGPTWLTGTYDPDTNLLYWPTGNPSPDYDGSARPGDNLYTDSVVALDAATGTLRWYFQFTPHDVYDWDSAQIPILIDRGASGKLQKILVQGNRNAFFYQLDAATGAYQFGKPFMKETWANGLNAKGKPETNPAAQPTETGATVFPGVAGAVNWESPTYSPVTRLIYLPALDRGGVFTSGHSAFHQGELFTGGSFEFFPDEASQAAVRAIDPVSGDVKWEYRNTATTVGGLLSTAGGLLFGSQDGTFFALDAESGHELWRVSIGGRSTAAPITFLNGGKQLITIAAGHDILTFGR